MPFDAMFLTAVAAELRPTLVGARVDKVQQPARDTVVLQLRGRDGGGRLLLSANGNRPRVHLTQAQLENPAHQPRIQLTGILRDNPAQPPMFCMLLRKHLAGGRLADIRQPAAERMLDLTFDCTDELGVPCRKHLILELVGRNSNLILTGPDGRILDCLRRVDFEMSELRQLLPGLFYHEPPRQDRRIPQETTEAELLALLDRPDAAMRLDKWLLAHFAGLSPLIARELSFRFAGETDAPIPTLDAARLAAFLTAEFAALPPVQMQPMLLWKDGAPTDFTYRDIRQYGGYLRAEPCESFSALLDRFYTETDHAERMRQRSQTLRKAISNLHERTRRKLELQRQELEATHDREQLRRQGDIVTANLHAITRGQTLLRAEDFYDEDLREIEIPLKPNLSPQQNAARFYKDYARAKHAEQVLTQQIAQGEIEESYLAGVLEELARAENERDLSEIRAELEAGGYVRPADRRKQARNFNPPPKRPRHQPSKPMHFRSSDGFDIFVGRNNRQNDQLSLKTARRDDLWLHVQKFHGTHVIIACAGVQPPDETITEAAELAAYYSEAREGQNVPVDVTPVRCLRKPNGAKPGMVVYDRYRTVLVTPDAALPARLRVE